MAERLGTQLQSGGLEQSIHTGLLGSGLEVCVVRPSGLTDEPATGKAVVTRKFSGRASIPRADVAAFMLDQVERAQFSERTPVITVTGG